MKEYEAVYTVLIDGATWGSESHTFEAEDSEEAIKIALKYEKNYLVFKDGRTRELLLDFIYDEKGEEMSFEHN